MFEAPLNLANQKFQQGYGMNKKFIIFLTIFIILYFTLGYISNIYIDYEWFNINKATGVFWTLFMTKFNVNSIFSGMFAGIFLLNFILMRVLGGGGRIFTNNILDRLRIPLLGSPRKILMIILVFAVIFLSLIMGSAASVYWKEYLIYQNSVPFDTLKFPVDPIFSMNMGFYVFSLPFYKFLYSWVLWSFIIITAFSIVFHLINGGVQLRDGSFDLSLFTRAHLSTLIALIVFIHGTGYLISSYELLYSQIGKFFGAGYTAVNANLMAYKVAMVLSFIGAALLLFNIFKRSFKLPVIVLITIIPALFILGTVYPMLQQRFIVEPNELDKEKPYILNNIQFTRLGYDINRVKEINFPNNTNLTYQDLKKNRSVIENIRLWDYRPLKQTYKQLQELKRYYYFNDVDVDRYVLDGKKTAVNLSARELSIERLAETSKTWINEHLIYTHGYGFVMNRVDKITPEGQPEMIVYDIPPKIKTKMELKRPQIYYGEHKNSYAITRTTIKPGEFDYPSGDTNKYTTYDGTGGTVIDSFFKKVIFALALKDINILISGNLTPETRILYRRNIQEMVSTLTPFLEFDKDPYLVISGGSLYWMMDAYTTSSKFPYSSPIRLNTGRKINYIRNSVKIVIDAYHGNVQYFISDPNDPIIQVYSKIFPGIFKKFSEMSEDLRKHVRYPEDLFNIQSHMLLKYHMLNPNVFYNNEDAWHIPKQVYDGKEELVKSYYLVTRLPNEKTNEFILIIPFTPFNKNNMIAFLVAKCDPESYGEMILYMLPKDKLSYGPLQIEARIDQDPEISKQLTLWSQKGSSVIRGNMLAIPIEDSLLFIEPLYLKADSSEMPELKKVIVSFADNVVMENSLDEALAKIFVKDGKYDDKDFSTRSYKENISDLTDKAYMYYMNAEGFMKGGNWAKYGEELNKLREVITKMKKMKD